jgi:hypothetical protein
MISDRFLRIKNHDSYLLIVFIGLFLCNPSPSDITAQVVGNGEKINPDLFGFFFGEGNYASDGGFYAKMVQNRSFEYNPTERKEWNLYSFWQFITPGFSYRRIIVKSSFPICPDHSHYMILYIEHVGHKAKYTGESGAGPKNSGFDGLVVEAGETCNLSLFTRQLSASPVNLKVIIQNNKDKILADRTFPIHLYMRIQKELYMLLHKPFLRGMPMLKLHLKILKI